MRKEKRVLTKSRTSPDPSEEWKACLREFGETKDFGTEITDQHHRPQVAFVTDVSVMWCRLHNEGDRSRLFSPTYSKLYIHHTKKNDDLVQMPKEKVNF